MVIQSAFLARVRRVGSKPPRYILARLVQEFHARLERYLAPARGRRFTGAAVAKACGCSDVEALWRRLSDRSYLVPECQAASLLALLPGERDRVVAEAEDAIALRLDLFGSGPMDLSPRIDWHRDHKTGFVWPSAYCRAIQYNNLDQPSDVKVPWEISRMQWLMPVAQAYQLTGAERYAAKVRDLVDDWIGANPYAFSVNWACTMDVALRAIVWTYFFHAFKHARSWQDEGFRGRFLASLYAHGDFTLRHLEKSDVNGNHYTADACGLVVIGLFFGSSAIFLALVTSSVPWLTAASSSGVPLSSTVLARCTESTDTPMTWAASPCETPAECWFAPTWYWAIEAATMARWPSDRWRRCRFSAMQ